MKFSQPLLRGTFTKRYKRFFADVTLPNGETVVAHCPNTGSMKTCMTAPEDAIPYEALILPVDDPKRKLKFTLEVSINPQGAYIGVNTHRTNQLALEALREKTITELAAYNTVKPEVKYGSQNSRIDALLTQENLPDCYVEVKNTTLLVGDGVVAFPDAVTTRGTKHLQELIEMLEAGHRAVMLYVVNRTDAHTFRVAEGIDPTYAETLRRAVKKGVEVLAYGVDISETEMVLKHPVKIEL